MACENGSVNISSQSLSLLPNSFLVSSIVVFFVFGTAGCITNIQCIAIFLHERMRRSAVNRLFAALSIFDLATLVFSGLYAGLIRLSQLRVIPVVTNTYSFKGFYFCLVTFNVCAMWCCVAIANARYKAVCFPVGPQMSRTKSLIVVAMILTCSIVFNTPRIFEKKILRCFVLVCDCVGACTQIDVTAFSKNCSGRSIEVTTTSYAAYLVGLLNGSSVDRIDDSSANLWPKISLPDCQDRIEATLRLLLSTSHWLALFFVPFSVMLVLYGIIAKSLQRANKARRISMGPQMSPRSRILDGRTTLMIFIITVSYPICYLPLCAAGLIESICGERCGQQDIQYCGNWKLLRATEILWHLGDILVCFQMTSTFFIYYVFSQRFSETFHRMVMTRRRSSKNGSRTDLTVLRPPPLVRASTAPLKLNEGRKIRTSTTSFKSLML